MVEVFTVSDEAAEGMLIVTGSVTTETDGVATVIGTETVGTDDETILGDITTGAVTGGEKEVPGTVEGVVCVKGGLARRAWRWVAWWQAALRRFFSLWAGPRWRGRGGGDG